MDITDDASIHAANNAGVALENDIEHDGLRTRFEKTFSVNAFGTVVAAEAFRPLPKLYRTPGDRECGLQRRKLHSNGRDSQRGVDESDLQVYKASKSALNSITISLAVANPDVHVVVVDPGLNVTWLNTYGVGADPNEGSQIIVDYALEIKGNSPGFYSGQGVLSW
ncbi:hypothetical protein FIBSPDRAFT_947189 [Athelia psychrophila]|uniref:NAD(P)-binding protein n=1 Tax=Athelia psychrophila TaxID=1759441 RepID=A0A166S9S7_9AGAM|nr:hypothetical protein FIBSPDRAFT_947189 [Fibularhizoctonia sp. CBS 109695]